jgi:hypothetical protein
VLAGRLRDSVIGFFLHAGEDVEEDASDAQCNDESNSTVTEDPIPVRREDSQVSAANRHLRQRACHWKDRKVCQTDLVEVRIVGIGRRFQLG